MAHFSCIRTVSDGEAQKEGIELEIRKFSKKISEACDISNQVDNQITQASSISKEIAGKSQYGAFQPLLKN